MKKTWSVNLGGSVYHIDEDAYQILMDYLQDVKSHLTEASADEVLNDIEQRISELFTQWMQGKREVITAADVRKVIDVLGRPEQYDNEEKPSDTEEGEQKESRKEERTRYESSHNGARRLYRDTDNALLGGVCAGVSAYLNIGIVLVRLIFFFLIWFWGAGILFYIAAWIIIPEARTAAQRLEMRGEDVTIENIERKVREEAGKVKDRVDGYVRSNKFHDGVRNASNGFVEVIRIICKVFFSIVAAVIGFSAFVALVALVVSLIAFWTGDVHFINAWPDEIQPLQHMLTNPSTATWLVLGMIITVGIPFIAMFRLLFGNALHMKPAARWEIWFGFIFWFIGIGLCMYFGLQMAHYYGGFWI